MSKLKNAQLQIPGGFVFFQPEMKWQSRPWSSLDGITSDLINVRKGNPVITKKYGWSTDYNTVYAEVEAFQVRICQTMGFTDYLADEGAASPPPPKLSPPQQQSSQSALAVAAASAKRIWAGAKTLSEWLDSNEPAVASELSTARAKTCSECPFNEPGDFEKWFTRPAAELLKRQMEKFSLRNLSTPYDEKLHTCRACLCVNNLSVHAPLHLKLKHMSHDVLAQLRTAPACWVISEQKGQKP